MHLRTLAPVGLFLGGVACIAAAVLTGEAEVSLFLVFPVFTGSSGLFVTGIALIVFSFITGFMFLMMGQVELASGGFDAGRSQTELGLPEKRTRYGGVVLLGPLPIAFGSDRNIALVMLVVGIVIAIVALTLLFVFLG